MKTYESIIRAKWMFDGCKTFPEMIERLEGMKVELENYQKNGVEISQEIDDDYGFLILETDDSKLAEELGFHELEIEE